MSRRTRRRSGLGACWGGQGRKTDDDGAGDDPLFDHNSVGTAHGSDRADPAGVGEADVRALEVLDGQLVGVDLADDLLVRGEEPVEVECVALADDRDEQGAAAVGLLLVDRQAHVDVRILDEARLAVVAQHVGVLHRRDRVGDRPDDRIPDQVREADLGLAGAGAEAVDHLAVDLEQFGRHVAEAGGRGNCEAGFHVASDGGAGSTDRRTRLVDRLSGRLVGGSGNG